MPVRSIAPGLHKLASTSTPECSVGVSGNQLSLHHKWTPRNPSLEPGPEIFVAMLTDDLRRRGRPKVMRCRICFRIAVWVRSESFGGVY